MASKSDAPNIKTKATDRRGAPAGGGTLDAKAFGSNGGRIGNPPHIKTTEMAKQIEAMCKVAGIKEVASALGISERTITRHYPEEAQRGKSSAIIAVGSRMLQKALGGDGPCMRFYLAHRSDAYSRKVQLTGAGGGPVAVVDLTRHLEGKSDDELRQLLPILEEILTAGSDDIEGSDSVDG